jgi:uncharacterized membrane protein
VPAAARPRLVALDWMRGMVMILMAIDHASGAFNSGRVFSDSAQMYKVGTLLAPDQFLTRWITHLCAPTFVFLAGTAAALSIERRLVAGEPARSVDRHLILRGLLLAALDPLWMTWGLTGGELMLLQVMYAIGTSFIAMAALRRLPQAWLIGCALFLIVGGEAIMGGAIALFGPHVPLPVALLLTGGMFGWLAVGYPTLPWLAIMMLGWAFGRALAFGRIQRPVRGLLYAGVLSLLTFVLVRAINGYGNLRLLRGDNSLVQWLHVSKYPPGLSYATLELGIMALLLAGFFVLSQRGRPFFGSGVLLVFGQTALFFYLLHVHVLEAIAMALGWHSKLGVASAYVGALGILVLLYPACVRYRAYKQAHPDNWTRFI